MKVLIRQDEFYPYREFVEDGADAPFAEEYDLPEELVSEYTHAQLRFEEAHERLRVAIEAIKTKRKLDEEKL